LLLRVKAKDRRAFEKRGENPGAYWQEIGGKTGKNGSIIPLRAWLGKKKTKKKEGGEARRPRSNSG